MATKTPKTATAEKTPDKKAVAPKVAKAPKKTASSVAPEATPLTAAKAGPKTKATPKAKAVPEVTAAAVAKAAPKTKAAPEAVAATKVKTATKAKTAPKANGVPETKAPTKAPVTPKSKTVQPDEASIEAPPEKAAKPKAKGKSPLSTKQVEHFRSLLLVERARLEEEREQIRSRSGAVDGALPEEGEGGDEDTADLANAMMDKEMDLSVEDEIEDLLSAVDHALKKIEEGTYGICDMSGDPIPPSRLELIPYAALTVECQAIAEG